MTLNEAIIGGGAVILGYLLGSIPSAYIATRLVTGQDIRHLGGGNVGGLNTAREVGFLPALFVGIVDLGKGSAAVAIAHWLLDLSLIPVLLTGLAAVVGHNWMVWLRFSGGKGMGAAVGALLVVMPVYGYLLGLVIFLAIVISLYAITRNIAFAMGLALLFLPLIIWLGTKSGTATIFAVILGLIIAAKFFPTARDAWVKTEHKRDFIFDPGKKR
ncbi:MAG: glycerol-3-phosphate acyltransferase [Dehalococcoidia bacterium]|nr:MAG: glycerol-3-phosphate acyltransferase [Dehalococcoidia bacterium]